MNKQEVTDAWVKAVIAKNKDKLGRGYNSYISYIPTDSEMSIMPVKYGMTDFDRKQAESHAPDFSHVADAKDWNVQFVMKDDDIIYFVGPDGFVWFIPDVGMSELTGMSAITASPNVEWDWGICVAAFDLNFHGANVPIETLNYSWYLARYLSDMAWMSEMGVRGPGN